MTAVDSDAKFGMLFCCFWELARYPEFSGLERNSSVSIASCSIMAFCNGVRSFGNDPGIVGFVGYVCWGKGGVSGMVKPVWFDEPEDCWDREGLWNWA